jgi:hypothetical protein
VVNLPGVEASWGAEIRGCIVAKDAENVLVGADVVSLEDTLKQHFIQPYDPEYVEEMDAEGFDPHVSLAVEAGRVTQEEYDRYVECKNNENEDDPTYQKVHKIRKPFKTVNYAAQYSVGKKTLARNSGMTEKEAQALLDTYWRKNWAVQKVAEDQYVKTLDDGSMWLKNPINGFYYSLRYDKDRFSTLVQGTGDYVFNLWTLFCREEGIVIHMNYHDEWLTNVPKGRQGEVYKKAQIAMDKANEVMQLNKEIKMDAKEGYSYAECH